MFASELHARLQSEKDLFLLDVRHDYELKFGKMEGSILIPLPQLPSRLYELPKDKTIVCICRSGSRSAFATDLLNAHGFNAVNLEGGILAWRKYDPSIIPY